MDRFFLKCDGVIVNAASLLEKQAIDALQKWLGHRPVICPAPFDFPIITKKEDTPTAAEVGAFLEEALKKHGPRSVIYVRPPHHP